MLFALLWQDGAFCLSRNFRLQKAGDFAWLEKNYKFSVISDAIDELVVLNVSRNEKDVSQFAEVIREVVYGTYVPVAAGGGVRSVDDAAVLLGNGADKVVVNSALFEEPDSVREIARTYGSQCVVAGVDYKIKADGTSEVYSQNGSELTELTVEQAARLAVGSGAGELMLQSMDKDGTGQGYDLTTLTRVADAISIPVIATGGVGGSRNLSEWLSTPRGYAACTANIFNFLGGGLAEARRVIREEGVELAEWEFGWRPGGDS